MSMDLCEASRHSECWRTGSLTMNDLSQQVVRRDRTESNCPYLRYGRSPTSRTRTANGVDPNGVDSTRRKYSTLAFRDRKARLTTKIQLLLLDAILHLPARTIPLLIQLTSRPLLKRYRRDVHRRLEKRRALLDSASFALTGDWIKWWTEKRHKLHFDADGEDLVLKISDQHNEFPIPFEERSHGFHRGSFRSASFSLLSPGRPTRVRSCCSTSLDFTFIRLCRRG